MTDPRATLRAKGLLDASGHLTDAGHAEVELQMARYRGALRARIERNDHA